MGFTKNMGGVDRLTRLLFAAVFIGNAIYFGWTWALIIGAVLGVTALIGICPAYLPLNISTVGLPHGKQR